MARITRKDLYSYKAICAEIVRRQNKIDASVIHAVDAVQSSAEYPFNRHTVKIEGDIYPPEAHDEQKKIALLKIRKREIEEAVEQILDPVVRYAVTRKYLENNYGERVTWETVADELDSLSGDAIRKKTERFLAEWERG